MDDFEQFDAFQRLQGIRAHRCGAFESRRILPRINRAASSRARFAVRASEERDAYMPNVEHYDLHKKHDFSAAAQPD